MKKSMEDEEGVERVENPLLIFFFVFSNYICVPRIAILAQSGNVQAVCSMYATILHELNEL